MTFPARIALLLPAAPSFAAGQVTRPVNDAPTVGEIAANYINARGGMAAIKAVRTLVLYGPPRPDGRPGRWMAKARPNYFVVGDPSTERTFAEGFDGASWEYYSDPGLVIRTTDAPAAASRHTAYFDDALVYFGEPGWTYEYAGKERIGDRDAYAVSFTMPDGEHRVAYVDAATWLVIAYRSAAPVHAFGEAVKTETRVLNYANVEGALFATQFADYDIATGKPLDGAVAPGWTRLQGNVTLPLSFFSPPPEPATPIARLANAMYANRMIPSDAIRWYDDFLANPATRLIETEGAMEAVGFQCLKNGAVATGILILQRNMERYPKSADAHYGLGRAYRTAGRESDAIAEFRSAIAIDPNHARARAALDAAGR